MSALPPYVINGNLYDALGAVQLSDVVMHNFCVPADAAKLQAWLDRTFKAPSGGAIQYRAIGDKIFLGIAEIGRLAVIPPKNGLEKGYTSEIDITVWILAERIDGGRHDLRWIPAYLFVDSGPALVAGREVWGFPKQLGEFRFSPQVPGGGARTFEADGWVVDSYGPNSPAHWAPMFQVRPAAPAERSGVLGSLEALAEKLVGRLTGDFATIAGRLSDAVGLGGMTMAFLKQFPDCAQPYSACYQAVVEARAATTQIRGAGLTDDHYELRISSFATHPYLDELGISSDWQAVGQGFWMDFDFRQELGTEIWRAGGPALREPAA